MEKYKKSFQAKINGAIKNSPSLLLHNFSFVKNGQVLDGN